MTIKISVGIKKLLIVEGKDEENFFKAVFNKQNTRSDVQIMPIGGKNNFKGSLKTLILDTEFSKIDSMAIVRDADSNLPGVHGPSWINSFNSVNNCLLANNLPGPQVHGQFVTGPPRIGVFIMPDGRSDGMLETLCMRSVQLNPEYTCVEGYLHCLSNNQIVPGNLDKAQAHVWLASRPKPDLRVGEAALAGYWDFDSPAFDDLRRFLQSI